MSRATLQTCAWVLGLISINLVHSEPCPGISSCAVAQLTAEQCPYCYSVERFTQMNEYVYVLFYAPRGNLNHDLLAKFEATAKEWRWSRVAFAKIDTTRDRPMAEKWNDPKMVPTNILFENGVGVQVAVKDLEVLKRKYEAKPEGQRWWLNKHLGSDSVGTNLQYVIPLKTEKTLQKLQRKTRVVVVGYFAEIGKSWDVFHEFVWHAHRGDTLPPEEALPWRMRANMTFASATSRALAPAELRKSLPCIVIYSESKLKSHFNPYKSRSDFLARLAQSMAELMPVTELPQNTEL